MAGEIPLEDDDGRLYENDYENTQEENGYENTQEELASLRASVAAQSLQIKQLQYILAHHFHAHCGEITSKPKILLTCPRCFSSDSLEFTKSRKYYCRKCGAITDTPISCVELSGITWL